MTRPDKDSLFPPRNPGDDIEFLQRPDLDKPDSFNNINPSGLQDLRDPRLPRTPGTNGLAGLGLHPNILHDPDTIGMMGPQWDGDFDPQNQPNIDGFPMPRRAGGQPGRGPFGFDQDRLPGGFSPGFGGGPGFGGFGF